MSRPVQHSCAAHRIHTIAALLPSRLPRDAAVVVLLLPAFAPSQRRHPPSQIVAFAPCTFLAVHCDFRTQARAVAVCAYHQKRATCPPPRRRVSWGLLRHRCFRSHLRSPGALSRPKSAIPPRLQRLRIAYSATAPSSSLQLRLRIDSHLSCDDVAPYLRRRLCDLIHLAQPTPDDALHREDTAHFGSVIIHPPLCAGGSTDAQDHSRLVAAA